MSSPPERSLFAGVDLSTKRIGVAAVTYDEPISFWLAHREVDQADRGAKRVRSAGIAARDCLVDIVRQSGLDVTSCAVELPVGRHVERALLPIFGGVCGGLPWSIPITALQSSKWRSLLGAKDTKPAGHAAVVSILWPAGVDAEDIRDERELDALGVALGYRAMLWENVDELVAVAGPGGTA